MAVLRSSACHGWFGRSAAVLRFLAMDERTRTEIEAAAFRRLVAHLQERTDVQNIELMNLAGFCRNCLSKWVAQAADERGEPVDLEAAKALVYGMPYDEWKAKFQK
jgi:hypothetical protein